MKFGTDIENLYGQVTVSTSQIHIQNTHKSFLSLSNDLKIQTVNPPKYKPWLVLLSYLASTVRTTYY